MRLRQFIPVRQFLSVVVLVTASLLLAVAPASADSPGDGVLCAASGYQQSGFQQSGFQQSGCGRVVRADSTAPAVAAASSGAASPSAGPGSHQPSKSQKTSGWIIGAVLIAALAGASYLRSLRRRR
jgi:hypothetical protein